MPGSDMRGSTELHFITLVMFYCSDITRGHEANPVQCVNGVDVEPEPQDFVYITNNCFTSNINVDRTITSLQVMNDLQRE